MNPVLNTQRILSVAQAIEDKHDRFDMSRFTHACGTPGCIGGYTLALFDPTHIPTNDASHVEDLLGLTYEQGNALLVPSPYSTSSRYAFTAPPRHKGHITAQHAVRALRHLAKTGVVDWDLTATKGDADAHPAH